MKKKSSNKKVSVKANKRVASESGDIVSLILRDHKPIKELISILKDPKASIAKKRPAFAEFGPTLSSHAKAEEESLYVHLKQKDPLRIEALEGDTEHAIADQLMKDVNESKGDDDNWMAKVKVLAELVDHHVKEEEKEVLKKVRKHFSTGERIEIGGGYSQLLAKHRSVQETEKPNKGISLSSPKASPKNRMNAVLENAKGRVAIPILLYFLGVPGLLVLFLWAVFFRG